jgi:hypothetical protein
MTTFLRSVLSLAAAGLVVAGFVGFVATHSIHTHVAAPEYFEDSLEASRVYDRVYDEVLVDPAFAPRVDLLLGGVNLQREDVVATIRKVIEPAYLQRMANEVVARLVAHFEHDAPLDLSLDITPVIEHVDEIAAAAANEVLVRLPVKEAASLDEFVQEFQLVLGLMHGQGRFPDALPTYPIPPEHQDEVAAVLIQAAELSPSRPADAKVIAAIRDAVAAGDVPRAIRASAAALLRTLVARSVYALIHDPHVTTVERDDGTHYILAPSPAVTAKVDKRLAWIRRLNRASGWARVLAAGAFVAGLALLVLVWRGRRSYQLAWTGTALAAGGALAFVGWLVTRDATEKALTTFIQSRKSLPGSVRGIFDDVMTHSVASLTPSIWIPSVVAMALGLVLIVAGARSSRG